MSSILAGPQPVSTDTYSCTHGAQINFGDLIPYQPMAVSNSFEGTVCEEREHG
jgi:hypothetical protein